MVSLLFEFLDVRECIIFILSTPYIFSPMLFDNALNWRHVIIPCSLLLLHGNNTSLIAPYFFLLDLDLLFSFLQ